MKLSILILLIFLTPLTLALSTDMKENYSPGETMIIKIQGEILEPINQQNIQFKRGHIQVPFIYDIKKLGSDYYLYAQIPLGEKNYTLYINDVSTRINGVPKKINFNQNFSVFGNTTQYSINPGLAIFSGSTEFMVFSYENSEINIPIDFPEEAEISLRPGENKINLNSQGQTGFKTINIGNYQIPIFILENQIENLDGTRISIVPIEIKTIVLENKENSYIFTITNNHDFSIKNINFNFDTSKISITPSQFFEIPSNSTKTFNLTISSSSNFSEDIEIKIGSITKTLKINYNLTSNGNQTSTSYIQENRTTIGYCIELGGKFCSNSQKCSTQETQALDGLCCTDSCQEIEEGNSSIIGWVLGGLIVLIIVWIFIKYRKTKTPKMKK